AVLKKNLEAQMANPMESKAFVQSVQCVWKERTPEQMREKASAVQEVPLELAAQKRMHTIH
ncbi:MAG: hypothetical protein IJT01_14115, partial [Selenomonadaceae bacterium]|nr:hypothetical protein [Selenomonadaceae bacterium]